MCVLTAGMSTTERNENFLDFVTGSCSLLLTSELSARGLDLNADHVILTDCPSAESLVHRLGVAEKRATIFTTPGTEELAKLVKNKSNLDSLFSIKYDR